MTETLLAAQQTEPESQDHALDAVPLSERRSPITMGLLWITMVTGFPSVLVGFEWVKQGLVFQQVLVCLLLSNLVLLLYAVPACYLGSQTGFTYSLLSRSVFGQWGSRLISVCLVILSMGWYGLTAYLMADALKGLFQLDLPVALLSAGFGILMAFNNFFGFSGIANFAGYLAAPVLVAWVGFTFCKASPNFTGAMLTEQPHQTFGAALSLISAFVLGYGAWGNEADFWRYGRVKKSYVVVPLVVSILIGQVVFPITGWILAQMTHITEFAQATAFMNRYSFGGLAPVAALVLFVTYFALADSCLYGSINGVENLYAISRRKLVATLTILGALLAAWLSGYPRAFQDVASMSSIVLPCATVIMLAEAYVVPKFSDRAIDLYRLYNFAELPVVNRGAVIAFMAGSAAGIATAGMIPSLEFLHIGISGLQAWLVSFLLYVFFRYVECRDRSGKDANQGL
ncbi:MAG: cytosine permease [Cyanobacteria bacterium SZAS LIN-5]|nr:cytosine permease [Cyanobacteria bacterium SZAS LIN-5]